MSQLSYAPVRQRVLCPISRYLLREPVVTRAESQDFVSEHLFLTFAARMVKVLQEALVLCTMLVFVCVVAQSLHILGTVFVQPRIESPVFVRHLDFFPDEDFAVFRLQAGVLVFEAAQDIGMLVRAQGLNVPFARPCELHVAVDVLVEFLLEVHHVIDTLVREPPSLCGNTVALRVASNLVLVPETHREPVEAWDDAGAEELHLRRALAIRQVDVSVAIGEHERIH